MKMTQAGLSLIKQYEGLQLKPYRCPAGIMTIGYGHAILGSERFSTITEQEAENLLIKDVEKAGSAIKRFIKININNNQFSALVSLGYNIGASALESSTLLSYVNQSKHLDVPNEFLKWVYVGSNKMKGLIKRRLEEARLYMEY